MRAILCNFPFISTDRKKKKKKNQRQPLRESRTLQRAIMLKCGKNLNEMVGGMGWGWGPSNIFMTAFSVEVSMLPSSSLEFYTSSKEPIIEAWTHLTKNWQYRWKIIQPWLKQRRICFLLFWWCMSHLISSVSHIEITWNSHSDAALKL